jgi:UDP-glucose 4-epimerase
LEGFDVTEIIHFAASTVVPESVRHPLAYYSNNSVNTCTLLAAAVKHGVKRFIFSSTAAVYGNATETPVREDAALEPISPYGTSKLISEMILRDVEKAHGIKHVILRYFNVAGADPRGRTGQSTPRATHLIKAACEAALGKRSRLEVFGNDYPTPDGTCLRDYIHVSDLIAAHSESLAYLRAGGESVTMNCGYGEPFSVLEVIETVKDVSGADFPVKISGRRPGDPASVVANVDRIRATLPWTPKFKNIRTIAQHALAWERNAALSDHRAGIAQGQAVRE